MKKTALAMLLNGGLGVGAIVAGFGATAAQAQVEIEFAPPSAYIATTPPVYYEGHASYYYGDRWYYREGPHWRYYHEEPRFLHEYRGRPVRQFYYGHAHGGGFRRR